MLSSQHAAAPRPRAAAILIATAVALPWLGAPAARAVPLPSGVARGQVEQHGYGAYALESLDTLLASGTDRYGAVQTDDLLVSILDVRTKQNVYPDATDELWRVERRQRRAPGGTNFLHNQQVLAAMYRASDATGDGKYADFADRNLTYSMANHVDGNGMFWWGWHRHYDVHTDQFLGEGDYHEIHANVTPLWDRMYAINPAAVTAEIEQIWQRHVVNKSTGEINRHDDGNVGLSFILSSGAFIEAFSFMYEKTGQTVWRDRASLLANYNWTRRNPATDLLADAPNTNRWDGQRSVSTLPGVFAPALYRAYEHSGDPNLRIQAMTYLIKWARAAWDAEAETFYGSLALDGTPIQGPRLANGSYDQYEPRGHVDMWQPDALSYEHPPEAALAYAQFYAATGQPEFRLWAERWAGVIRRSLPATDVRDDAHYRGYNANWAPFGTHAEHYGLAIDFFVTMFDSTDEDHYLFSARDVAKEAVSSLWYEGLFRGHPNKPYYEAVDGVGLLVDALLKLDARSDLFALFGDFNHDDAVDALDFEIMTANWLTQVAPYASGDVTGDGFVGLEDFGRFKFEYFPGPASALPGSLPIPEPTAPTLAALAIAAGCMIRRSGAPSISSPTGDRR